MRPSLIVAIAFLALGPGHPAHASLAVPRDDASTGYLDLLDLHGMPKTATDRSFNIFFDAGAWHGYSLPPAGDATTGFVGPFVHSLGNGQWVGMRFAQVALRDAADGHDIALTPDESHAAPGYLVRSFSGPDLVLRQTLFFADAWHALVRIELTATRTQQLELAVTGRAMPGREAALTADNGTVAQGFADSHASLSTRLYAGDTPAGRASISASGYRLALQQPLQLKPRQTTVLFVEQQLADNAHTAAPSVDAATAWANNRARWSGYLASVEASHLPGLPDATARRVAAKAVQTLLGNWRAARGDIRHDGVIPSYSNPDFNGFWAWDSWKHAAALARFAPQLARDQIRAMFDYQGADGMVPDCLYLDKADNNWRDSKPPLATWAVWEVYQATGDTAFLGEMYGKLVRYHRWWFEARDHDRNGLAEFGSTDGTRIAAAWESGMDNAVRFDGVAMLRNRDGAWSMNQESVDLNAYLYREKIDLARIAALLGKADEQRQWLQEAAAMKHAVQARMFDTSKGYFFDARLGGGELQRIYGPEGWTPLWAGLASPAQAAAVARIMLDPRKFATVMPFPTLAADDPRLSPIKGYWRGPVWLDQAYFGVEALRRYGFVRQADMQARRLVLAAKGLTGQAPFYENYDPLTGQGYQSANFSWSAASYLLLLQPQAGRRQPASG